MSINTSAAGAGTASNSSVTILLGRILLAVIFLLSGFGKLTAISGTAAYFGGLGLPAPTATRTATSRRRDVARANSMLARLRHASNSTSEAMPSTSEETTTSGPSEAGRLLMLTRDNA